MPSYKTKMKIKKKVGVPCKSHYFSKLLNKKKKKRCIYISLSKWGESLVNERLPGVWLGD